MIDNFVKAPANERAEKKDDPEEITLWFNVPYIGSTGENLIKAFRKKMTRLLNTKKKIKIKTFFKTSQLRDFASTKDRVPILSKSNVVYEVCCPGCGANYVGKTERTIRERTIEHAWSDVESPMRNHLKTCQHFRHLFGMFAMFDERCPDEEKESLRNFSIQAIQDGVRILDTESNWNQLLYKEALNIERKDPTLNKGLKASRQLRLFR